MIQDGWKAIYKIFLSIIELSKEDILAATDELRLIETFKEIFDEFKSDDYDINFLLETTLDFEIEDKLLD